MVHLDWKQSNVASHCPVFSSVICEQCVSLVILASPKAPCIYWGCIFLSFAFASRFCHSCFRPVCIWLVFCIHSYMYDREWARFLFDYQCVRRWGFFFGFRTLVMFRPVFKHIMQFWIFSINITKKATDSKIVQSPIVRFVCLLSIRLFSCPTAITVEFR